jgi:hypothetical protein
MLNNTFDLQIEGTLLNLGISQFSRILDSQMEKLFLNHTNPL